MNGGTLDIAAADLRPGDDLQGAGIVTAILTAEKAVVVTLVDQRLVSLAPDETVTVSRRSAANQTYDVKEPAA